MIASAFFRGALYNMTYMHSSSSKRRTLVKRIVAYAAMTVAVLALSAVLVLLMLGYRFNRYSGTIQQGGLVQFISQPSGASVFVGDIQLANKTRSKITLNPGTYLIKMQREGYQPWQKNATVKAGTVLWLNSARLVPDNPETTAVLPLASVASTSVRPGIDSFAILKKSTVPTITLVDIDGEEISQEAVDLPAARYHEAKKHRFTLGAWLDDRRLLVKHAYDGTQEWIVVDTDDVAKSYAVEAAPGAKPVEVIADPRSSERVLVLRSDGSVTLEDVSSGQTTPLPVEDVTHIAADGSTLFFTAALRGGGTSTNYLTLGKTEPRRLATYDTDQPVYLASGEYFGVRHVATAVGETVTIVKATAWPASDSDDPLRFETVKTVALPSAARAVDFKSQGRFVVISQRASQTTYDLELDAESDVSIVGAGKRPVKQPAWLDQFHYWSDAGGAMRQYEFDGSNQIDIVDVAPGFSAVYTSNDKYLYTIGKTDKGYQLQRTRMVLD